MLISIRDVAHSSGSSRSISWMSGNVLWPQAEPRGEYLRYFASVTFPSYVENLQKSLFLFLWP